MRSLASKSRKNFFTIITIVGLLVIFSFYFFIYVPRQEHFLQQDNFRILTRIAGNVEDRVNEYRQYVNDGARKSLAQSYTPAKTKAVAKDTSVFENAYTKALAPYFLERPEAELIYFCPVSVHPDPELIHVKLDHAVKPWFHFIRDTCSFNGVNFEYGFTLNATGIEFLLHDAAFENCFLQRNGRIIAGPGAGVLAGSEDSLLLFTNGIKTGRVFTQQISGSEKKVFVQPFRLSNEEDFVLCGYIDRDEYQKKTRNLSATMILVILLILFLLALSLPFVKLLLMSRNERLGISDAFLAGITVILGTSVVVLILLDVYTYFIPTKETRLQQLTKLSDEINMNFQKEVAAACRQLNAYDSLIGTDKEGLFSHNIVSLRDSPVMEVKEPNMVQLSYFKATSFPAQIVKPVYYGNFTQVFWADSTGEQLFKWATGKQTTPLINVSEREYFKNITADKTWSLPGSGTKDFFLEGVYSWTTAENMAVITKKSAHRIPVDVHSGSSLILLPATKQTHMVAMTTTLTSVMDPILAMSNGYCIMDNTGKVIFHSDKSKNLNENFLDECSAREEMRSAIYSRTPDFFNTAYQGGDYKMYIRPVDNLPFYLVTFQDNIYAVTSNTEVLTLSVLLVVFFFLFICVQVIVLHFIIVKDRALKGKSFTFGWLWPLKEKKAAYQHILVFLVPAFLMLVFFLRHAGPVETLLMFFASSIFVFSFVYLKMDQFTEHGVRKKIKEFISADNMQILSAGLMMLVILNIVSVYLIDNSVRFCAFQVMLCALAALILVTDIPVLKVFSYRRCYLVILVGILMLVSIIPTFAFFRISFRKVAEVRIRHTQLELAMEMNRKSDGLNKSYTGDGLQKDIYSGFFYSTKVSHLKSKGIAAKTNSVSPEEDVFSGISVSLTPSYNEVVKKEHDLATSALDGSWKWKKSGGDTMELSYIDLQRSAVPGVDSLLVRSVIPAYKLPLPFGAHGFGVRGTLFWIGMLLSMIGLYCFIRFFVRIIFTTDFFRNNQYTRSAFASPDGYFNTTNVFLVGAPFSGKTSWLKNQFQTDKIKYHVNLGAVRTLEDVNTQLEKCTQADVIVIDHFEYGIKDYEVVGTRLLFFEGLKQLEHKRILVASNIHPLLFLREYPEAPLKEEEDEKVQKEKKLHAENRKSDLDRWTRILGGYHKIYFPASGITEKDAPDYSSGDIIDRECNNSYFLRAQKKVIREIMANEQAGHALTDEEIILRIESLAHVYYNSIWASLSEEEQYILYDVAQDGLVNLKNREVLTMLLNKGLLVYENRFKMMNESFRNFVLSEVSPDDALELEQKVKVTGSWNYFRTPVVIILVTIALFIFITQEETFNSIIAFITTFAAGIPIIFRLLGMITSMKGAKVG